MSSALPPIPPPDPSKTTIQVISTSKKSHFKAVLISLIIIISLSGTGSAVYFIGFRQLLNPKAFDCDGYKFTISQVGDVSVTNDSSSPEPAQKVSISINGSPTALLDVPPLAAGATSEIAQISVPISRQFTWDAVGSTACINHGSYVTDIPTPTVTPETYLQPSPQPTTPVVALALPTSAAPTSAPVYYPPSPTPPDQIVATGTFENTLLITTISFILIGLGTLLAI